MTEDASSYVSEALAILEQHSVMRERVDWPALRQEAFAAAAHAVAPADTYPAIRLALARLGDGHSFFVPPDVLRRWHAALMRGPGMEVKHPEGIVVRVFPGGAAERAGLQAGDRIESINGEHYGSLNAEGQHALVRAPRLELVVNRSGTVQSVAAAFEPELYSPHLLPQGRRVAPTVGLLELPAYIGHGSSEEELKAMHRRYAVTIQQLIEEQAERGVCRWVVDLRRNGGGDMWPMLLGLGALLGDGECLTFVYPDRQDSVVHEGGVMLIDGNEVLRVEGPGGASRHTAPVAILLSPLTRSSGEFVALALVGRSGARSFGEPSFGTPTANEYFHLSDGARIVLTVALGADRTVRTYDGPLIPDERAPIDWRAIESDQEPALQAAIAWIEQQE